MIDGGQGEGGIGEHDEFKAAPPPSEAPIPTETKIERPSVEDIPELLELWKQQYDYHHNLDPDYYAEFTDELRAEIEADLHGMIEAEDPHILVARDGAAIQGFITFGGEVDDYHDANITNYGVLKEVLVADGTRGRGIGRKLVTAGEEHFAEQGVTDIMVQCSAFNTDALAVYEAMGYVERQKLLYKNLGEDADTDESSSEALKQAEVLPEKLAEMLKPEETAVIVVDMMDAYCDPEAPFPKSIDATTGELEVAAARIDHFLAESRTLGIASTVFVKMLERPETVTENIRAKLEIDGIPPVAERDGVGWDYYGVQPMEGDHEIVKTRYNAFTDTDLHQHLQDRKIKTIIVVGGYGSTCVLATALMGSDVYGYNVFVPKDLTADLDSANPREDPSSLPGVLKALGLVFGYTPESPAIVNSWKEATSK